jgi:drug/metabolite transporter (DMT)-like permease
MSLATIVAITVAVLAISSSAPLIAYASAPALAIAFWRNGLASAILVPVAGVTRRTELRGLFGRAGRRTLAGCVLAGVFLAAHFATWVPSVKYTDVASAVALGATQPVWQGLIALGQGRALGRFTWIGIGFAVAGAFAATGADFGVSHRAVIGDLLAVAGGMAAAVYTAFGERVRAGTSTIGYTTICYSVCAAVLLAVCLVFRVHLTGYAGTTWLAILGLVAGAQLLGHSMFSYAMHHVSATTVSVLILLEVPGAALLAWAWLGQTPTPASVPGLALLLIGVVVVVLGGRRANRAGTVPAPEDGVIEPAR